MKKLEIGEEILRQAAKCKKGFACLSGDDKCLSDVEHSIQDTVCYVKCEDSSCPYFVSHDFLGSVCSCPVRVEIFKRFKQ